MSIDGRTTERHKAPGKIKEFREKVRELKQEKIVWQKIDTNTIRICEMGNRLNNKNCNEIAYRKVHSKFGDKWTCDNCAQLLCRLSENNWEFYIAK